MGSLSRSQLLVYGAVAVTLLLVGARWIRSAEEPGSLAGGVSVSPASGSSTSSGGAFSVDPQGGGDVVVHVAGAVKEPDVYRLPAGSRVSDAVERAGGATARAEVEGLNLAAPLTDGQQIIMPARTVGPGGVAAGAGPAGVAAGSGGAGTTDAPIGLGTATVEELDTIEGIGPVTAQKIIEFRTQQGGTSSVDQLDQIDGIGPATMDALRSRLQP
ncbi:MAG: ComEA family DNA-binding protein [Actinomycetota bacterium]